MGVACTKAANKDSPSKDFCENLDMVGMLKALTWSDLKNQEAGVGKLSYEE